MEQAPQEILTEAHTTRECDKLSIELRLSDIDPPLPDPTRTIYRDIVNLPNPAKLGLTIRYFNHDDVGLYFQITGSGTGYTFGTVNLGLLGSGADAYVNLDEFASRARPSASDLPNGEMEENITLILKAYTDSGYTNLKWTFERVVTVHWINSADPAFTVDVLNNFDDGTVQDWAYVVEAYPATPVTTFGVATDYVLSAPYSLRLDGSWSAYTGEFRYRLYKSFTTPNKSKVFAIIDLRFWKSGTVGVSNFKELRIQRDDTILVKIGNYVAAAGDIVPEGKWLRFVVPLPPNTTLEFRIITRDYYQGASGAGQQLCRRLDDFKIISK